MKEEIKITKEDLVMWLDRPPSDDDFDLCSFLAKAVENQKKYYEENKSLQSQLKAKEEMVKVMEKYFELIIDLGFDYDGLNLIGSLKNLIDELVRFAKLGRACNITEAIYEMENKKFNILHEEILSKGENK